MRYNFAAESDGAALTVTNSSISARYLEFKGGANYTVSSTVTGNDATAANNTLKISAGTTTFTGAVSNFGNVTVASGATLAVGTGGSLDLSGASVTLASAITNSGTVTLSGTTVFALDNLTATNGTYSLITGNSVADVSGVSFTRDGSAIKSSRLSVSTASGYAVTVTNYSDLVWAGTAENSVWNTTAENWSSTTAGDSVAFENRDSVTFGTNAGVSKIVSVASVVVANSVTVSDSYEFAFSNNGSVTASTMSIADGKTLTLSGTGTLTTGAVSGGGNLTVGAGTEATFTAANTLSGSMTLDGTLNLNNSVLSVSENTNTATISALSSLTGFSGSGRLVLDITGKGAAKNVDFSPVSGFTGTLVVKGASRMNLLGETGSLNAINQFAGIEVQSGAQLYLSAWTGEGTRVSNLSRTLTIAGAGYGSGTEAAALRMADNATLSGQLILSGNATVYSATGTQTISGGISAAGKTLTINGANILNISGTADITIGTLTLNKSGDTNLSATG
ncbi:MAG: beta strand repeat-containing protein, partial [Candidatus Spyradosoma sp.]